MSLALTDQRAIGSPLMMARVTCGSRMPLGSDPRTCEIASRTSLVARSTGVSIVNWTNIWTSPSVIVVLISSTPSRLRTAASTFCAICVSISTGAAPGCEMSTITAGKVISGLSLMSMRMNATIPAKVSAANSTSANTGLRIDQAEMLRMMNVLSGPLRGQFRFSWGMTFSPTLRKAPAE